MRRIIKMASLGSNLFVPGNQTKIYGVSGDVVVPNPDPY